MFYKKILVLICLLFSVCFPRVSSAGMEEVGDATCRISTGVSSGTGIIFKEDEDELFILTAAHVLLDDKGSAQLNLSVKLYNSGKISHAIPAYNVFAHYMPKTTLDIAVIKIRKADLLSYPKPDVIPLAEKDYEIKEGDIILSFGCPQGFWPSGWKGNVVIAEQGRTVVRPYAIPGRSGSGIFDKEGTKVIGIIIWRSGTAVPLGLIHAVLETHGI
tara:strand:- start:1309 stop:1956 length:648 start_codon:yes stop_codon:yes gene_type:complete